MYCFVLFHVSRSDRQINVTHWVFTLHPASLLYAHIAILTFTSVILLVLIKKTALKPFQSL